MSRTRLDLRDEALANLGIIQQAYTGATRTRADLVSEALASLGINQQFLPNGTKTRAQIVAEAMNILGVVQKTPTVSAGTKTLADLISQVLFNLGALGEGNTVPSADATVAVTSAAANVARMLDARQVVSISNTNAIDNAYFLPFAAIVTEAMKEQYGIDADTTEAAGLVADAKQAELDLKIMTRAALVDAKVDAVAADLDARAVAGFAVPVVTMEQKYFHSFSATVANSVKGYFEWLPADTLARVATEAAEGERRILTIGSVVLVDEKVDAIAAELKNRAVVSLTIPVVTVPEQYFPAMASIVANSVKGKFNWLDKEVLARATGEAQIAERTLKNLTRTYLVERNIDSIISELAAREIVYLVDDSAIPDEWFSHLAWIVADRSKGKFELAPEKMQEAAAEGASAIMTLRELTRGRPSYNTLRTAFM